MSTRPLSPRAAHALLHFTVFVWGFTAILGRGISLPAIPLVWYRTGVVVLVMGALAMVRGRALRLPGRTTGALWGAGVLVALHWLLFYAGIKYAGVAVSVLCLSTSTFFTALLEPLIFRRRVHAGELLIGLLVVAGVSLLVKVETQATGLGLAMGLGSAFFSAAFGTLNGKLSPGLTPEAVTVHELSSAFGVTTLFFLGRPGDFVGPLAVSGHDAGLLLVLAVGCTVLPWLWSLRVLLTLKPYTVALAVALEPVYSMALAWGFFPGSEQLTARFYLGAAALVGLVGVNGWMRRREPG